MTTRTEITEDNAPNLFAICKPRKGEVVARRIRLTSRLQVAVGRMFERQAESFREGNVEDIPYETSGTWKAGPDETFVTPLTPDAASIFNQITGGSLAVEELDTEDLSRGNIKALCVPSYPIDGTRVLVQGFTAQQLLQRRDLIAMVLQHDRFDRLSDPVLTLGRSLVCIVEEQQMLFKGLQAVRPIFDLKERYKAATEKEVMAFVQAEVFDNTNIEYVVDALDQLDRKRITEIQTRGILTNLTTKYSQEVADQTEFPIRVSDGKVQIPAERYLLKAFLQFISDSRWRGAFSGTPFITNSQRPAPPLN